MIGQAERESVVMTLARFLVPQKFRCMKSETSRRLNTKAAHHGKSNAWHLARCRKIEPGLPIDNVPHSVNYLACIYNEIRHSRTMHSLLDFWTPLELVCDQGQSTQMACGRFVVITVSFRRMTAICTIVCASVNT